MAKYEEIAIDQGADVSVELHLVNQDGSAKDLTNHTLTAKLKRTYNSDSADTLVFTPGIYDPTTAGICSISLTNLQTDTLKAGRYVYDVELSFLDSDGDTVIERILEGHIHVNPSVTR